MKTSDASFAGSVPRIYETLLVPLLFQPYAEDLAARAAARLERGGASRVLEVAAGTGALTRELAARLPGNASIVATDLNPPMLERAAARGTARPVEWRQADAMRLPFDEASFDAVVCQFGAMFFPDRPAAFAEARRVLRAGGVLLFSTWDRIEDNELAACVQEALETVFPHDPPRFMERTPHGYHDRERIVRDVREGGFAESPRVETVTRRSVAASARDAAVAFCQGTPLLDEIAARNAAMLDVATTAAEVALARRFGSGPVDAKMQAFVVEVGR
jgi:ubiquinone/menaquinone biosynthesis C-methylase UbiE